MATLALGTIATKAFGEATFGAAMGAAVGSIIDSSVMSFFGGSQTPQNYGDVQIQAADEGTAIWRCLGPYNRVPGTVIYASAPRSVTQPGNSKRQEPASISWYADLAIASVANDIDSFERIRADGREIMDRRPDPSVSLSIGGTSGTVLMSHSRAWVRGQLVSSFGPPKYRASYWHLHLETRPLAESFGSITGIEIRSVSSVTAQDGSYWTRMTLARTHGYSSGRRFYVTILSLPGNVPDWGHEYWWARSVDATTIEIPVRSTTLGTPNASSIAYIQTTTPFSAAASAATEGFLTFDLGRPVAIENVTQGHRYPMSGYGGFLDSPFKVVSRERLDNDRYRLVLDINTGIDSTFSSDDGDYQGEWFPPARAPSPGSKRTGYAPGGTSQPEDPFLWISETDDAVTITQERDNRLDKLTNDYEYSFDPTASGSHVYPTDTQPVSTILENALGSTDTPAYRPLANFVVKDFNLSGYGSRIPNFELFCKESTTRTLADAITSICAEYGVTALTSTLSGNLSGMSWSGSIEGTQVLQPLMLAYDIVAQETASGVRFFRRKDATTVAVTTADLASASSGGVVPRVRFSRASSARKPRSVRVKFYDLENDLVLGEVLENVTGIVEGIDESITLPISLTNAQARNIARRILRLGQLDMVATFALPPTYMHLLENDVVTFTLGERDYRVRLTTVDVGLDFRIDCRGLVEPVYSLDADDDLDDLSDSLSRSGGGNDYQPPPLAVEVVSGVSLDGSHDRNRGYYVFATPFDPASRFVGGSVYVSTDDGVTWVERGEVSAATIAYVQGQDIAAITDADGSKADSTSVVGVAPVGDAVYESDDAPVEEVITGVTPTTKQRAMLGDEAIAYETATFLDDGSYEVTDLIRAQLQTSIQEHAAGERFVALEANAAAWVSIEANEWDRDHLIRVVPYGATVDEVASVTHTVGKEPDHDEADTFTIDGLEATDYRDGIMLTWSPIESTDLIYYEVRRGDYWHEATVIGRVEDPWLRIPDPAPGERTYHVRARFAGLLYSPEAASVSITPAGPDGSSSAATQTDIVTSAGGTASGCTYDGTEKWLTIDDNTYTATYTAAEVDAGSVANWMWAVEVDSYEVDERPVSEFGSDVKSVELAVWNGLGRPPSKSYPGGDHEFTASGKDYPSYVDADRHGYGQKGTYGTHTRCKVDVRFDTDGLGSWTSYEPYTLQRRSARKMQVRLTLQRWTPDIQRRVTRISAEARS